MKFCSNCGEKIDERAVVCPKCGVPVSGESTITQSTTTAPKQGHGAATASLVLGIIGLICGVISVIVAICVYAFYTGVSAYDAYRTYAAYSTVDNSVRIGITILVSLIPGILSLIGLPLGCFCRKGGPKIAGIVLNIITLVLVIADIILIMFV